MKVLRWNREQPLAGTRGWYEHAFEARSFIIPATLALMFLAIELLVLKR